MNLKLNLVMVSIIVAITVPAAYAVISNLDDTTINDTTNNDGTAFTVRTDTVSPSSESVFLFSHNGNVGAEAWKMRVQQSSDGLSFVKVGTGEVMRLVGSNVGIGTAAPQEKLDVNGNIRLTGNILSPGDICIGACT